MRKIVAVARKEYLERVRSKGFIISTILVPVLMASFIALPLLIAFLSRDSKNVVAIYDATGDYRDAIESVFQKQGSLSMIWVNWQSESEREATLKGIETGKIAGYLALKEVDGNLEATYAAKNVVDFAFNSQLETLIQRATSRLALKKKGLTDEEIARIENPVRFKTQKISDASRGERAAFSDFVLSYILAMLIYGTLITYGFAVMNSVMEEKSSRVMETLISSVSPFDLMVGKIAGVGLVALTQYVIWAVVGIGLSAMSVQYGSKFQIDLSPALLSWFIAFFALGYLIYSTLYAAIGAAFENAQDAQSLTTPITLLVVIPVIALNYVISKPDSLASTLLSLAPFFAPILMLARLSAGDVPFWQVTLSILLMLGTFYGAIWVSAKIYRVGVLMLGKKPSISELLKWLRRA